jgi:hypothetical protein
MTTQKPINPFAIMKALPFDMTNLIGEFIGEEDKKEYYSKTLLFSKEFNDKLSEIHTDEYDEDYEEEIRHKLFKLKHSVNKSEVNFYEDNNGSPIISFKQFYNNNKWFKGNYLEIAEYDMNIYSLEDMRELFSDFIEEDRNLCEIETEYIERYLRSCGIRLSYEQIDYMKNYNDDMMLSILGSLIRDNLIDNTIDFAEYMVEDCLYSKLIVIEVLFGDKDIRIELDDGNLLVLGN